MSNTKKRSKGDTHSKELFEEETFLISELPRLRETAVGEECSLQFLDSLRGKKGEGSFFLPNSLFVRQEMLQIWDELSTHTQDERVKSQALIGSPGVGKSVLFFLYALHLAKESDKKVMYWQKATEDTKNITLFCLDSKVQDGAERRVRIRFRNKIPDVVDLIYYYTGGWIRDALKLLRGQNSFQERKSDISSLNNALPEGAVDLAIRGKYGTKDPNSFDQLRTYFEVENRNPLQHIQIVDSGYALSLLENREMESKYLDAYKEAVKMTEMKIAGLNFKQMMHKVFIRLAQADSKVVPFSGHVKATGTTLEGVRHIEKEKYWIPSVPNFPSIDAALIDDGGSIVGVQYFAGKRHGFKERAYKCSFLNHIPGTFNANKDSSRIVYVMPSDQQGRPNDTTTCPSKVVEIKCDTMVSVMEDAPNVFK